MEREEMVSIRQAARLAGVSHTKVRQLIADGRLQSYTSLANAQVRLVRPSELRALLAPVPEARPAEAAETTA